MVSGIARQRTGIFYGYWIVLVGFFTFFLQNGCSFYAFPLFVKSLQTDFGWGRGQIMLGITFLYMTTALVSPLIGRLIEHHHPAKIIAAGFLVISLGFSLLSQLNGLWLFYTGWTIVGAGGAAAGQIAISSVIGNWFKKRRGTAIGLMGIGVGVGGFVLAPVIGGYLIPGIGWRASLIVMGVLNLIFIPAVLLVIKTRPADMGLFPDNEEPAGNVVTGKTAPTGGLMLQAALATAAFWLLALSFLLSQFAEAGVVQNQVPFLEDTGFPVATAATALGMVGLGSAFGKFFFGWLCDRLLPKYVYLIGISLQAGGILILMSIKAESSVTVIWAYAILMGLGIGSWLPTISMTTSSTFGAAHYGAIFGLINFFQLSGVALGPLTAGFLYDAMHTYRWAFMLFVSLYIIAIPVVLLVRRPRGTEGENRS